MNLERINPREKNNETEDRSENHLDVIAHDELREGESDDLMEEAREATAGEHHSSNLYDQDEDAAGNRIDLATGKAIDNSTDFGLSNEIIDLTNTFDPEKEKPANQIGLSKRDAAAQWLKDNGHEL